MNIFIDGDGCPVKQEVISIAKQFHISVILVTSFDHFSTRYPDTKTIYVDPGVDRADYKIIEHIQKGDVCVTQDYGLASLVLNKQAFAFHHLFQYKKDTIDLLLLQRYESQQQRKKGKKRKGPNRFLQQDRLTFQRTFYHFLKEYQTCM